MTGHPVASAEPALRLDGLSKRFGGVHALSGVSFEVRAGEIHGLLGENGSGKSTLIKVLAGFHEPDAGTLELYGKRVDLPLPPGEFRRYGMDFVHQDLGLMPTLSVVENLWMGELAAEDGWRPISWRRLRRRTREVFKRYGLTIDPRARVEDLRPVERALLAIVRGAEGVRTALGAEHGARGILVLDEPTVFLPKTGTEQLFGLIRDIVAFGASVVFVSHDLAEVREITDTVTVLRDGRAVGTAETRHITEAELIELIIGRKLERSTGARAKVDRSGTLVEATGISGATVHNIDLDLHAGEVVGVTGLVGSGFEEVPYILFGAARVRHGALRIGKEEFNVDRMNPARALQVGMALIPANRQRDGSVLSLSVADNLTLRTLDAYSRRGLYLSRRRMMRDARRLVSEYDVRPPQPRAVFSSLSGGNQQKVLLAKWLQTKPTLLLLDEPTQGVDVGARQQIFSVIRRVAAGGAAVVCASSDYEQLGAICDRVVVIARGRIADELTGADVTKDRITEKCYNSMSLSTDASLVGAVATDGDELEG